MVARDQYLERADIEYNPVERLLRETVTETGYHSRIADGAIVHPTRSSMDYAIANLQSRDATREQRACDIIDRIAALQVTNPTDRHYGIWSRYMEEPPEQMSPADWNWADFIGTRLAQALRIHGSQLRGSTSAAARASLFRAAMSIFRRNVDPGYTNIAIMGAVVTAAAGEILDLPFLIEYARVRLANILHLAAKDGGFAEYNSPTYTRVAIEEAERALLLVSDPTIRERSERIRTIAWRMLAEHYHPATGQIAGPCSRAYSDWLMPGLNRFFAEQTNVAVPFRPDGTAASDPPDCQIVPALPCPPDLVARFAAIPTNPHEISHRLGSNAQGPFVGTTWFMRDACLGTINRSICWHQRRPLLGYWRTASDPAVCLRLRFLKDGQDFAAAYVFQQQRGPRVLSAFCLSYDAGSFHPLFDKSPDNTFVCNDLRMRISLAGNGVQATSLGDGRFALMAGGWQATITTPEGCRLGQEAIRWRAGESSPELACVDAVMHEGPGFRLDCRATVLHLAFALELAEIGQAATSKPPESTAANDATCWTWQSLSVQCPKMPVQMHM